MSSSLWSCRDPLVWRQTYAQLPAALLARSASLPRLHDDYVESVRLRGPLTSLTRDELIGLMTYKLARGSFRPRLAKLIASNSPSEVTSVTSAACAYAATLTAADAHADGAMIDALTKLNGVGPATASLIMSVIRADLFPFMCDEAMTSMPASALSKPIAYSRRYYQTFAQQIRNKTAEINGAAAAAAAAADADADSDTGKPVPLTANACADCLFIARILNANTAPTTKLNALKRKRIESTSSAPLVIAADTTATTAAAASASTTIVGSPLAEAVRISKRAMLNAAAAAAAATVTASSAVTAASRSMAI